MSTNINKHELETTTVKRQPIKVSCEHELGTNKMVQIRR